MHDRSWLRLREWAQLVARQPLLFLLALFAGIVLGAAYSYVPLHAAKNWSLDYLDTQLAIQNQRVRDLEDRLQRRDLASQGQLPASEASALRSALVQAEAERDRQTERADAAKNRLAKSDASGDQWRAKYREMNAELGRVKEQTAQLATERDGLLARLATVGSQSAPPPAALGREASVLADGLELRVGEAWSSPDGRVSLEVVDVEQAIASLRGSWQPRMAGPERVAVGHELSQRFDDAVYRISISAVSPFQSVTVRASFEPR